jgi:hypothetical protein
MENPSYAPAGENSIVKWPEEITAVPKVFHIEITEDKKRIAFLTRNTYEEAKHIAEDYCSYGTKTV